MGILMSEWHRLEYHHRRMRIELRNENRQRIGRILVDPAQRPTRATVVPFRPPALIRSVQRTIRRASAIVRPSDQDASAADRHDIDAAIAPPPSTEVFLNWDTALDDAGQLRRCVACGCPDLFKEKAFPQVTGFVVVLAFVGALVGVFGLVTNLPVLIVMAVVLVLDISILLFSRRRLVCYRCRSTYHDLPIARYHRSWDRTTADRHPAPGSVATPPGSPRTMTATAAATR